MKKSFLFLGLFFAVIFMVPACSLFSGQTSNREQESNVESNIVSGEGKPMFHGLYDTDSNLADRFVESLLQAIEKQNSSGVKLLFSENVLANENVDEQISELLEFYKGSMRSYTCSALYSLESQDGSSYNKEVMAAYSVCTTTCEYRLAIKICATDSENLSNQGICSLYITKADAVDSELVYWGGHAWIPGVIIEK